MSDVFLKCPACGDYDILCDVTACYSKVPVDRDGYQLPHGKCTVTRVDKIWCADCEAELDIAEWEDGDWSKPIKSLKLK